DISGSSALYKRIGDEQAKAIIDASIHFMSALTIVHEGIVVKTIGDEIMARFDSATHACETAIAIQQRAIKDPQLQDLGIRIGIAFGDVLITADDVFGDKVNNAACVAQIARANQIVIPQSTVHALDPQLRQDCQLFDRINFKGDQEETAIYRLQWEHTGNNSRATLLIPIDDIEGYAEKFQLSLQVKGATTLLLPEQTPFAIGRDAYK